jgi:hypothetical protein
LPYTTQEAIDIHFGNNISLKPGHYLIVVQVERTTAAFAVALTT